MPDPSPGVAAIDAAYAAELKTLFQNLCRALAVDHDEKKSVAIFKAGFELSKQARDLALNVVSAPATLAAARVAEVPAAKAKAASTRKGK